MGGVCCQPFSRAAPPEDKKEEVVMESREEDTHNTVLKNLPTEVIPRCRPCSLCPRPAAYGFSHCCRTCESTNGKSHGPACEAANAARGAAPSARGASPKVESGRTVGIDTKAEMLEDASAADPDSPSLLKEVFREERMISPKEEKISCASKAISDATGASEVVSMFAEYANMDSISDEEECEPDWYIDPVQELLRMKQILITEVTYYQAMDLNHKADVWCNDTEDMIDKMEVCGTLLKGTEAVADDGSKWIKIDDHHFLPVVTQGCRVIFEGDRKFKPVDNEWVIDTTRELQAESSHGVGWYSGMDLNRGIKNSMKPNGKVVKGSTSFDRKGVPWICVDASVGLFMPIFIDEKQVAFPCGDL